MGVLRRGHTEGRIVYYLYSTWRSIKERCFNPKHKGYKWYGGRGIRLHESCRDKFAALAENVLGDRPEGMALGRIDNDRATYRAIYVEQLRLNQHRTALKLVP